MHRQHGQALLLIVFALAIGTGAVFYTYYSPSSELIRSEQITATALAQARDALIGRAAADEDRPGSLPCPDTDNDGQENWDGAGSNCTSYVGRLPWVSLGLPDLRDGSGERLWYALSPTFRDHVFVEPLNSDKAGQFTITGTSPATKVIAIIFAPGPPLSTQSRGGANVNDVTHYLEGENNNGELLFATGLPTNSFNDRLLPLSSDALFTVVTARVAKEARQALELYRSANGYYPYANDYADGAPYACKDGQREGRLPLFIQIGCGSLADWSGALPAWFGSNLWNAVTHYGMDNTCALTVTGHTTNACAVVIVSGQALGVQTRPCVIVMNCLEDAENYNGDSIYVKPSRPPTSNDRMAVSCAVATPCPAVP